MDERTFNAGEIIDVLVPRPDGTIKVSVRFPTDEEWIDRFRKRNTIIRNLGRGAQETTIANRESSDMELYTKIKQDGSVEIDAYEAAAVIDQLALAEVVDCQRVGNSYQVELRVPGVVTKHVVRTPSQKEMYLCTDGTVKVSQGKFNIQQVRIHLGPSKELYDKLKESVEGYMGDVPVLHKYRVIDAVHVMINELKEGGGTDENF